jgi:hypothetical protein
MANTSGEFYSRYGNTLGANGRWKVSWKIAEQSEATNSTTIDWSISMVDGAAFVGDFYLAINGIKLMAWSDVFPMASSYCIKMEEEEDIWTGQYKITHDNDGNASFTFNFIYHIDSINNEYLINETFQVKPFPRIATITSTSAYLGEDITITINKKSTNTIFTYSLAYTFGELKGDIIQNTTANTATFTLPTTFYAQMPDTANKSGEIICTTYRSGVLEGTSKTIFNAMINPDSCKPILTPTVKDILSETLALTGDENTIVKYESMVEYAFNAIALNGATIAKTTIACGSKKITGLEQGVIDDAESGKFIFTVVDSRGFTAEKTIEKNTINYLKPTCNQTVKINLADDGSGAEAKVVISGKCFKGSFGLTDNTILVEVRHTQLDGSMGEWVDLTPLLPELSNDNTYELEFTVSGLTYSQEYTFQSRLTDKLNFVQSSQYTSRVLPIFDWSKEEFNFNVPVNMKGDTVLRYNEEAHNVVLSAGGNIYLRPGGTDDTSAETIFYSDGRIKFGGEIDMSEAMPDYVIETGSEAMGSNGTWYWEKWKSGKAICYGSRNFGRMAITTTFGNMYRGATQEQALPTGLFAYTPEVININMNEATYNGWIARMEGTLASADNTGSFAYVRPGGGATVTVSQIGFYVVGRWK